MENSELLKIENLQTYFRTEFGLARAVDGVDLTLHQGETVALVGESGCGKSVLSLSLMGLVPKPAGKIHSGKFTLNGKEIPVHSEKQMRSFRGKSIAMIFQEPMTSLNPVMKIGKQLTEAISVHNKNKAGKKIKNKNEIYKQAKEALKQVGLADTEKIMKGYPHNLSGGMKQRVMIAMAISCNPAVLIADEPTTALDVTVQAQIMRLLSELQKKSNMSILLITHDLELVSDESKTIYIMYGGKIVEQGPTQEIISNPLHPYSMGLLNSRPGLAANKKDRLYSIKGQVPPATEYKDFCRFAPRCEFAKEKCLSEMPKLLNPSSNIQSKRKVACFYPLQ